VLDVAQSLDVDENDFVVADDGEREARQVLLGALLREDVLDFRDVFDRRRCATSREDRGDKKHSREAGSGHVPELREINCRCFRLQLTSVAMAQQYPEGREHYLVVVYQVLDLTVANRHEEAISLLEHEREVSYRAGNNRQVADFSRDLAWILVELNRDADVVAAYQRAEAAMPLEADYKTMLARALLKVNRTDEALAKAVEAVAQAGTDAYRLHSAWAQLGEVFLTLGRDADTVHAFHQLASEYVITGTKDDLPAYFFDLNVASALVQRGLVFDEVRSYAEMVIKKSEAEDDTITRKRAQEIIEAINLEIGRP
jgi:tetratricopeptide (TPR) repeat protein